MTFTQIIPCALAAFVAIAIAQVVAGIIVRMKPVGVPHLALWMLVNLAITVAALAPVAARAEWQGRRLGTAVAAIPLAVFSMNLIEELVYLPNTSLEWGKIFCTRWSQRCSACRCGPTCSSAEMSQAITSIPSSRNRVANSFGSL
jgi:hypothetical protein